MFCYNVFSLAEQAMSSVPLTDVGVSHIDITNCVYPTRALYSFKLWGIDATSFRHPWPCNTILQTKAIIVIIVALVFGHMQHPNRAQMHILCIAETAC